MNLFISMIKKINNLLIIIVLAVFFLFGILDVIILKEKFNALIYKK